MSERLRIEGGDNRFQLVGELDAYEATALQRSLATVDGQVVVIDLAGVTFIDSAGLHELVEQKKQHGGVRLVNPSPRVARIAAILGLADFLFGDGD
jgi:anti-anti-sigma factor